MIKVLFVIDTLNIGGAEKSLLQIISRFKKYKPVVCHIYNGESLKHDFENQGIEVISLRQIGKYNFAESIKKVRDVVSSVNPVLIHSSLFRSDIISRKLNLKKPIPLVNSFVNNSYADIRYTNLNLIHKLKLFIVQLIDRFTSNKVNLFFSNSETIKISNSKALGVPLDKIKVIFRGRDSRLYIETNNSIYSDFIKQYNLQGKKIVLNIGRLLDRKGQFDLIKSFAIVKTKIPDSVLLIAGEGAYRNTLENSIGSFNLNESVILLGNITAIPDLLSLADCFVLPSYYEGLPGVLIEAMLAGKIIIASDIPENKECVDDNSALFFNPGDCKVLASLISEVLMDTNKYNNLGAVAKSMAIDKFDLDAIAIQYEETYDKIIASFK